MASWVDRAYVAYFVLHIVITALIDSAIALPQEWQFPIQQRALKFHIEQNNDLLVIASPVWLKAFVWIEILLQMPFFAWAAVDLSRGRKRVWPAIVAYGVEASTTTFACLAEVMFLDASNSVKMNLLGLYVPTFIVPFIMAVDFGRRIAKELNVKTKIE